MVKHIASAEEFAAIKAAGKPVRACVRANERTNERVDTSRESFIHLCDLNESQSIDRSIGRMTNGFRRVSERAMTND